MRHRIGQVSFLAATIALGSLAQAKTVKTTSSSVTSNSASFTSTVDESYSALKDQFTTRLFNVVKTRLPIENVSFSAKPTSTDEDQQNFVMTKDDLKQKIEITYYATMYLRSSTQPQRVVFQVKEKNSECLKDPEPVSSGSSTLTCYASQDVEIEGPIYQPSTGAFTFSKNSTADILKFTASLSATSLNVTQHQTYFTFTKSSVEAAAHSILKSLRLESKVAPEKITRDNIMAAVATTIKPINTGVLQ